MNKKFCQSCGMPITMPEQQGTNADGSKNGDYCVYCYKDGAFTADCTMEEMIQFCLNLQGEGEFFKDKEKARQRMEQWFPTLKRWKK